MGDTYIYSTWMQCSDLVEDPIYEIKVNSELDAADHEEGVSVSNSQFENSILTTNSPQNCISWVYTMVNIFYCHKRLL